MTLVESVGTEAAEVVHAIVMAAFQDRPPLDPPADALSETPSSLGLALKQGGLVAQYDGAPVGALIFDPSGSTLWLRRFGVLPTHQHHGVAGLLIEAALTQPGFDEVAVLARQELPSALGFWRSHGFVEVARRAPYVELRRPMPRRYDVPDADSMRSLGRSLGSVWQPGDLVVLAGALGAGKTTFTQGLGAGLGVRGDVTSPTFVIARVHPSLVDGPALVHVDAYRLGGLVELDDLDLDTSLDDAVTVVEWGTGLAEGLAESRLDITIERIGGADPGNGPDPRVVTLTPHGARWLGVGLPVSPVDRGN